MRWLWRLVMVLLLVGLLRSAWAPQTQTFISSPASADWKEKIELEVGQWQRFVQDLPSNIEVELKRLWQEFQPDGTGETV